jgi:PQQ-like domain
LKRSVPVLVVALVGCGVRLAPPPTVFPAATRWTLPLPAAIEGPLASDGARVFVATSEGRLLAVDVASGATAWEREAGEGTLGADAGLVVLRRPDGTVLALDPADGSTRWQAETAVTGSLAPVLDASSVYVAGEGLAALKRRNGKPLWSAAATVVTPPLVAGDRLLVADDTGALRALDRASGATLWSYDAGTPLRAGPAVDDKGRILLGTTSRQIVSLGPKGHRRWRWKLGADVDSPPAVLGDRVLVASYEDVLYALKLGSGNMVWRAPLPSRPLSGPLLHGSAVLVACQENDLVAFDARDGKRLGGLKTPSEMRNAPILVGDRLVLGLRNPWAIAALELGVAPPTPEPSPSGSPAAPSPPVPGSPAAAGSPDTAGSAPPAPAPAPSATASPPAQP